MGEIDRKMSEVDRKMRHASKVRVCLFMFVLLACAYFTVALFWINFNNSSANHES